METGLGGMRSGTDTCGLHMVVVVFDVVFGNVNGTGAEEGNVLEVHRGGLLLFFADGPSAEEGDDLHGRN